MPPCAPFVEAPVVQGVHDAAADFARDWLATVSASHGTGWLLAASHL